MSWISLLQKRFFHVLFCSGFAMAFIFGARTGVVAAETPLGLQAYSSDPLAITLDGTTRYDLWLNLSGSAQIRTSTGGFGFTSVPGNSGYGMFPGNAAWPGPIYSQYQSANVLSADRATLVKIDNGAGGAPYPSGSSMYYGGASGVPNTDGGTLGVGSKALSGVNTIAFQISLGEAYGYTFYDGILPTLQLLDANGQNIGTALAANYSGIIKQVYNGSLEMPPGSGVNEDVYINVFGLQWDLSGAGDFASYRIDFTGVQHAQLYSMRLDQSTAIYGDFVFDVSTLWTGSGSSNNWSDESNWQGAVVPATVGKAIVSSGDSLVIDQNTTIGQLLINGDENLVVSSNNGSSLTVDLNITTEKSIAASGLTEHVISAALAFSTTTTLNIAEDTSLHISGGITGVGFYKRGEGDLYLTGGNSFEAEKKLVFGGGTTYISGTNEGDGVTLSIKNARVVLHGDDERVASSYKVELAGTSTAGQTAYLQLGDASGAIKQTFADLSATQPQYDATLNPEASAHPPVYVVGGNANVSTIVLNSGDYAGFLGGTGLNENNLSVIKRGSGNLILKDISTYSGDTIVEGGILEIARADALSSNSNLVLKGGLLGLSTFSYRSSTGTVRESLGSFTASLGSGANQIRFDGDGGFTALRGDQVSIEQVNRTVNLGGDGAEVTWGSGGFIGDGRLLTLTSSSVLTKLIFENGINLGNQVRDIQSTPNGLAEITGILSGAGGVNKMGTGSLILSGLNSYTGVTRVTSGRLQVSNLADGGLNSSIGKSSSDASNIVLAGGALTYVGASNASTNRRITIESTSESSNLTDGGGTLASDGVGAVHFTSTDAVAFSGAASKKLILRGVNNLTNQFDGLITDHGSYKTSLIKQGDGASANTGGVWRLGNAANSYTGVTFVNSGFLEVTKLANGNQVSSIGASSNVASNLIFFRAGLRYLGSGDSTDRLISISAFSGSAPGATIDSSGTGALKFTNTGAIGLTSAASGTTAAIGTGGHLVLSGSNTSDNTFAPLIGGTNATNSRVSKNGAGRWTLTGNNTYAGITEVLQGTLEIKGTHSGSGVYNVSAGAHLKVNGQLSNATGALTLSGGTLSGSGTINKAVTFDAGDILSPGNSAGSINFTGNQTWGTGGTYLWEIKSSATGGISGTHWDLNNITGGLTISATTGNKFTIDVDSLLLSDNATKGVLDGWNPLLNYSWEIARTTTGVTGFNAGVFAFNYGDFSTYNSLNGGSFALSQSGNSLYLNFTAAPEPGRMLLLLGALTAMMFRRKR